MQSISIIEPIKIRLRRYKSLFRRALPLEKHEKAILGLIYQNNGDYGFSELGTVLGFAVEDNPELQVRKDVAEIQLFESYLENLKSNDLIDYNNQSVRLTFWGEKAINDDCKYSFYSGNLQIPEFFDIALSNEASDFTFKEIGVEVKLTNEQNLNKAWDLAEFEAPDPNLIHQFHMNRFNKNDEIIFDNIEPLSNLGLIETYLEFSERNSSIEVLYESKLHEQLSKEINKTPNTLKADNLKLKINCKKLVEAKEAFLIEDLADFIAIVDWSIVIEKPNIIWNNSSIGFLDKFQVNWNLISSKAPVSIIQDAIDDYIDKFDWLEVTNRLNLEFILANIDKYPWDVDVLTDIVTLDDFKDHVSRIIKLPGIDLYKFYEQCDKDFIRQNFNQLPNITSYISNNDSSELLEYVLGYSDAPWNHTLVSQKLSLPEIESNFSALKQNLNFEILIERFISDSYDCKNELFEETISFLSFSDDIKILNRFSKCDLSLTKLQILDNHELIYWGNDVAPGFELNPFQNWSIDTVRTFENKWGYSEAIEYLSGNISDSEIIEKLNFEWDFAAISKNSRLVNQENFFEENKNRLDVNSAIHVFDKNTLKSNLRSLFLLDQENKLEDLPLVISKLFNLDDIIEINVELEDLFLGISSEIDWKQIWSKTPKSFVKEHIEETFNLVESIPSFSSLLTEITNCFEVEDVFELPDFAWDWNNVTERAIEEAIIDNELLDEFADLWEWKIILERHIDLDDIINPKRLTQIAFWINDATEKVRKEAWRFITEIYPSHKIFELINSTNDIEIFQWDWDYLSSSNKISLDLNTLHRYKERINWSLLSSNSFLNGFFRNDREIYGTRKEWENHVLSYLSEFTELWDFKELSKLDNITRSENIVNYFRQKWDWDILSSEKSKLLTTKNKEGIVFNERLFQKFERFINFEVISHRKDALLDFEILNKFNDKNWDWKILSSNESLKIEKEILLNELFEKPWDWKILSNNPAIAFSNEDLLLLRDKDLDWSHFSTKGWIANATIVELADKTWDWHAISNSSQLIFDQNLLRILSNKEIVNWGNVLSSSNLHCNEKTIGIIASSIKDLKELWSTLSSNQNLSFENEILLDEYKEFWDWDILIRSNKIDVNSELILRKYQDYLNWSALSSDSSFNADISILNEFKNLLDWKHVTTKISLSDQLLENFKSFIDWKVLSRYSDFSGQLPLIKKYSDFIDFEGLENNPTIDYETSLYIENYLKENIHKRFVYNLKKQRSNWAGYVYHFTHLKNAIDIIKKCQILSRNKATIGGDFSDAAGDVVNRRHDAHDYARFYFRPQTPTQFYNECLGKDHESGRYGWTKDHYGNWEQVWKSDFDKALNLGLPKCPIPVFFKFSIDEIFNNQLEKCYISNGNLQTNWARIGTVSEMYNLFDFNDVYSTIQSTSDGDWKTYMNKSQQEFLVRDQFDFSDIHNYEILVRNQSDLFQLKHLLKDYPKVIQKIRIADYDDDIYLNNNKQIEYNLDGNSVTVSANYNGNGNRSGYFEMEVEKGTYRINSGQVLSKNGDTIRFYPGINIEFESEPCLKVTFKDQVTNKEPWEIIKYCNSRKATSSDIHINSILNKELGYQGMCDLLNLQGHGFNNVEDNYDPYKLYRHVFDKEYISTHDNIIDYDSIYFLVVSNKNSLNKYDILSCKRLIALYINDLSGLSDELISLLNSKNIQIIHQGLSDWYFDCEDLIGIKENQKELAKSESQYSQHDSIHNYPQSIDELCKLSTSFVETYNTKVRHYILRDHTNLVLNQFDKYFAIQFNEPERAFFRFFLLVHDIGKPRAFQLGNKDDQYTHSIEILNGIWGKVSNSHNDLSKIQFLLNGDIMGEYFQGKKDAESTTQLIVEAAKALNTSPSKLFDELIIYYQCDTAAYTADAGGYKFLEHLFSYENGQKVFDEEAGLLRFSDKYREMYNRLKDEILKWQ
ncbi:DarT ssDNA thymidine ADP-ribosyltransferase family protein [Oceanihabitans sp. IOP_32]|uniref:DarT ssDNA thymidine ADP-ribosyltransferase family protein n=1 Tax=Oceanihabitans sp. IOP_32 TaxID=2529032 RepID=UPI0018849D56|nr:DarT ssDNA thymidine ADP-ribosyltransferase family protein [Oceanihabitans sp. IOP_32]